jgi:hypothetical protein
MVSGVTFELGRSLLLADAVAPRALASALELVATRGVSLARALTELGVVDPRRLEEELARAKAPVLRHVVPVAALVARLPAGLCARLLAVPVREDVKSGSVDVAVVDARDAHAPDEIAYWLGMPVRVVRTTYASMDAALARMATMPEPRPNVPPHAPAPPPVAAPARAVRVTAETPLYGTRIARAPHPPVSIVEVDGADVVIELRQRKRTSRPPVWPRVPEADASPPSRTPITARGPFSANAPSAPFADIASVLAGIRGETSRDAVLALLVAGARTVARKVALFVIKRNELVGWICTPELGDVTSFRALRVRLDAPTILARALPGGTHLGRILKSAANAALLALMNDPASEVAVTGVRVEGHPAVVILAGELGDTMIATRRLDELARVAGEALAVIVREKARR